MLKRKRGGEREAQFNPALSLSTVSSGPVRNQQQESGIKRLCTERRSRNSPSYSPQRLSESHTPAPALSFFFHWLSLRILSNNSHSGERGVYTWPVTVCPAYPLSPWLDLNASALILPPGLRNGCWLINASRKHKHRAIARGESARIEIENVQVH